MPELYRRIVAYLEKSEKTLVQVLTDIKKPCIVHRIVGIDMSKVNLEEIKPDQIEEEELAVNYVPSIAEGYPVIVDHKNSRHFIIDYNKKRILVVRKDLPNAFYHARVTRPHGDYLYDGILLDALEEFQGYKFFETRKKSLEDYSKDRDEKEALIGHIPTTEIKDIKSLF